MAPSTPRKNKQTSKRRLQSPLTTPRNSKRVRKEYDTPARARYFEALSTRFERDKSIRDIDKEHEICKKIGYLWRQNASNRRPGKQRLERPLKLFDATLDMLISPTRNPYRDIFLEHQIDQFDLNTHILGECLSQWQGKRQKAKGKRQKARQADDVCNELLV